MADTFSPKETQLIYAVIENLEAPIKVNWEGAKTKTGHSNGSSAERQWYKIRTRLGIGGTPSKSAKGKSDAPMTPTSGSKRKSASEGQGKDAEEDAGGDESPTAAKKARKNSKHSGQDNDGAAELKTEESSDAV